MADSAKGEAEMAGESEEQGQDGPHGSLFCANHVAWVSCVASP